MGTPESNTEFIATGKSLDLDFTEPVVGFGFYYQQGLYPTNFNIYYADGSTKAIVRMGYFPQLGILG